jgi:hypothetical protein
MGAKNGEPTYSMFQPSQLLRKVLSLHFGLVRTAVKGEQAVQRCA